LRTFLHEKLFVYEVSSYGLQSPTEQIREKTGQRDTHRTNTTLPKPLEYDCFLFIQRTKRTPCDCQTPICLFILYVITKGTKKVSGCIQRYFLTPW